MIGTLSELAAIPSVKGEPSEGAPFGKEPRRALDKMLEHPQLHGIQVGIATYLMSVVQDHRYRRVDTIFTQTGFWDYVKTLNLKREDFEQAIDLAPSIKPFRYTYLHEKQYRDRAKEVLRTDARLQQILQ